MTSISTSLIEGTTSSVALKAPVRVATTANITLSGAQAIDGISVVADDRVLVKNQTDTTENGIYIASSSPWERALDFDGARDVATGTQVFVVLGTTNVATYWYVSTAGNPDPGEAMAFSQATLTGQSFGTISSQNASAVAITGGTITGITDLAVADGGTAASTAAGARTNLGLGTISTQAANNVAITGGAVTGITDLAVADGGTGAGTAANARTNLGVYSTAQVDALVPAAASQSDQETATSTTTYVSPGRQHYHPSAAKAWLNCNGTGVIAIRGSYNVTGITDTGTGIITVTIANDMADANYAVAANYTTSATAEAVGWQAKVTDQAVGSFNITTGVDDSAAATKTDAALVCAIVFGDL